jgi:hypothetical protein
LIFKIVLEYATRKVQVNQEGLKLNGTHGFLVFVDINTWGGSVSTIKKNTELEWPSVRRLV